MRTWQTASTKNCDGAIPTCLPTSRSTTAHRCKPSGSGSNRRSADHRQRDDPGFFGGITGALPAMTRAVKLQRRAARVGFDWEAPAQVLDKIEEETEEVRQAMAEPSQTAETQAEIGDLLFAVINLARMLDINPETALRQTNRRFEQRFLHVPGKPWKNGARPRKQPHLQGWSNSGNRPNKPLGRRIDSPVVVRKLVARPRPDGYRQLVAVFPGSVCESRIRPADHARTHRTG